MDDQELAGIANALYALPLDEFIAARTAAAKEAAGGTEGLPAAVRALPKPSVAAWAVNMLAAHQPDVLDQLSQLGGRMRAAQSSLDAAEMRELGRERRALLATAVDAACSVAERHGRRISGAVATAVEETLRAATADTGAAAAVQSGRLLQVLSADGVDTVDLDGAVAVPGAVAAPAAIATPRTAAPNPGPVPAHSKRSDTTADDPAPAGPAKPRLQAVRQAPRPASPSALEKAQAAEREASEAAEQAVRQAEELRQQHEAAEADFTRLTNEAKELRAQLKATEEELESTRRLRETAAAEAKQAARAADKAQRSAMLARERALRLGNTRS
jgi:hypothetical protein